MCTPSWCGSLAGGYHLMLRTICPANTSAIATKCSIHNNQEALIGTYNRNNIGAVKQHSGL